MNLFSRLFGSFFKLFSNKTDNERNVAIVEKKPEKNETETERKEIHNLWDYLNFKPNTQAYHLISIVGFEEWIDMEEIRRRIMDLFGINYKNERSLYPYLKALTDSNLFETTDVGGRRKWRKKTLFVELKKKVSAEKEEKKEAVKESEEKAAEKETA